MRSWTRSSFFAKEDGKYAYSKAQFLKARDLTEAESNTASHPGRNAQSHAAKAVRGG